MCIAVSKDGCLMIVSDIVRDDDTGVVVGFLNWFERLFELSGVGSGVYILMIRSVCWKDI